jgi:dienelactone hydrolase
MILVGLNGTTIWPISNGRVSQYFSTGIFPYQWTYRKHAWRKLLPKMPNKPYILTGFSAGGTLCHQIGARDPNCKGIMVHSGMFYDPITPREDLPILLLRTEGDIFPTYKGTYEAFRFYNQYHYTNTRLDTLAKTHWHGHEYANGLPSMREWCKNLFDYDLPIKEKYVCR